MWGYGYASAPAAAWKSAGVDIGLTSIGTSTTLVRADGYAIWLDPTPLPDNQPGSRMRITMATGCPTSDEGYAGVTNPPPALADALLPPQAPTGGLVCRYYGMNDRPYALKSQAVLDSGGATALAQEIQRLPLTHTNGDIIFCPMDDGAATVVVLAYPHRGDVDLWVRTTGCQTIANGYILTANDGTITP